MGASTASLISERWLDEILLLATDPNLNGDTATQISLPAGLGDVAIMEVLVDADTAATLMTGPELRGPRAVIINAAGTTVDIVGVSRWTQRELTVPSLSTYFSPDPLVLWRQNERLELKFQEVDTNASPTVDLAAYIKCVRVRPLEAAGLPVQLVR